MNERALEVFPNVNFSDPRVKWGDMSGDGLQDILLIHDGNVEYWPNLGYGDWGSANSHGNSPRFPYGYDPRRILVGDVDGDGLADMVYVEDTKVTLWINQSGNGWSDAAHHRRHAAGVRHGRRAPGGYAGQRRQRGAVERGRHWPTAAPITSSSTSRAASSPTCWTRWTTTWVL